MFRQNIVIKLFFVVFFVLLTIRAKTFFYPPYWDSLTGPFMEAVWLYENNFDYNSLATQMLGFEQGGPRVYFFSIYPTLQAVLMSLIKSKEIFLLFNHALTYILASLSIVFLFKIANLVFNVRNSLLICVLCFFHPLFLSQASAINMEMPVLLLGLMAVYYFVLGKYSLSRIILLLGFYIKASCLVFSSGLVLLCFVSGKKVKGRLALAASFTIPFFLYFIQTLIGRAIYFKPEKLAPMLSKIDLLHIKSLAMTYIQLIPDIYIATVFGLISLVAIFILDKDKWRKEFVRYVKENLVILISAIICFITLVLSQLMWGFLPRYFLPVLPFMSILLVYIFLRLGKEMPAVITFIVLILYVLNLRGDIYGRIRTFKGNNGHLLERTLAFEDDIENNMALVTLLERKYPDRIVATSWPILHMLSSPHFYYTQKHFQLISSDYEAFSWKGVRKLRDIDLTDRYYADKIIFVWGNNCYSQYTKPDFNKDIILDVVKKGNSEIVVYRKIF